MSGVRKLSSNPARKFLLLNAEPEALGQCKPPPRHVLPVPPSGESVSMNIC